MRVVVGTYSVSNGELEDSTRSVEFDGELLARHSRRNETGGVRQRLFKTADNRYIVSVATWTAKPQERTTYTLHEANKIDLSLGGRFEDLGAHVGSEPLSLGAALDNPTSEAIMTQKTSTDWERLETAWPGLDSRARRLLAEFAEALAAK